MCACPIQIHQVEVKHRMAVLPLNMHTFVTDWGSWHVYSHNRLCCLSHKYNILYVFYHTCWSSTVWLIYLMNACDVFSHSDSQKSDSKCTLEPIVYRTIPSMWLCFIPLAQCVEGSHRQRKASAGWGLVHVAAILNRKSVKLFHSLALI